MGPPAPHHRQFLCGGKNRIVLGNDKVFLRSSNVSERSSKGSVGMYVNPKLRRSNTCWGSLVLVRFTVNYETNRCRMELPEPTSLKSALSVRCDQQSGAGS